MLPTGHSRCRVGCILLIGAALIEVTGCASGSDAPGSDATAASGAPGGAGGSTGGAGGGPGGDGGMGGTPSIDKFDLSEGTWIIENVSNTAGTISHDGVIAITDDDVATVAFSEPAAVAITDQDIWTTVNTGAGWSASEPRTNDTAVQNAFPSIKAEGSTLHLVFNGYPEGVNDIYYLKHTEAGWMRKANLTASFETAGSARHDYAPSLALGPGGALAVAYASHPEDDSTPAEIRVLRIKDGQAVGAPETAIPAPGGPCYEPKAVFDSGGRLHVVADCGALFDEDIHYAVFDGGSWQTEVLPGNEGKDDVSSAIAVGADGDTVHVAWTSYVDCGGRPCGRVQYTKTRGGAFMAPMAIADVPGGDQHSPTLAVDAFDRPIVAYHQMNTQNFGDVFVTWSGDGASFEPAQNLTEGSDTSDEWFARSLILHPKTGLPMLLFQAIVPMTDPLNSEVMRASYAPPSTP